MLDGSPLVWTGRTTARWAATSSGTGSSTLMMTTWPSLRFSRLKRCMLHKCKNWHANFSLFLDSVGDWPPCCADQLLDLPRTDGCLDSLQPSVLLPSCKCKAQTGCVQTKPSTNWWSNQHHMAATSAEHWRSTSQSGGNKRQNNYTRKASTCQRWTSTTRPPSCQNLTPPSTPNSCENQNAAIEL